jgi:hypothetical protein
MSKIEFFLQKLKAQNTLAVHEIGDFLHRFAEFIGFECIDVQTIDAARAILMDTSHIRLRLGDEMPCIYIIPKVPLRNGNLFSDIKDFLIDNHLEKNVCLLINPSPGPEWHQLCKTSILALVNIAPPEFNQLRTSNNPRQELVKIIKSQLGFSRLIPYKYAGEITQDSMFFGRKKELSELVLSSTNFALYGHRRAGKTSLMKKALNTLSKMNYECEYFDCRNTRTYQDFLDKITLKYLPRRTLRTNSHNFLYSLKHIGRRYNGRVVLFFDEVDIFLKMDLENQFVILSALHEAAANKWCRFVLAGYRLLFTLCRNKESPIHTLLSPLQISALDEDSAKELIRKPMNELGLEVDGAEISHIQRLTGRHPAFIQFYCGLIASTLGLSGHSKVATEDLVQIESSSAFLNFITEYTLGDIETVERVIIYTLLKDLSHNLRALSFSALHRSLSDLNVNIGISDLDSHIFHLDQINILARKGDEISFSLDAIPRTMRALDIDYRLAKDLQEIEKCGTQHG